MIGLCRVLGPTPRSAQVHTAPALLGETALLQGLDGADSEQHHLRPSSLRCALPARHAAKGAASCMDCAGIRMAGAGSYWHVAAALTGIRKPWERGRRRRKGQLAGLWALEREGCTYGTGRRRPCRQHGPLKRGARPCCCCRTRQMSLLWLLPLRNLLPLLRRQPALFHRAVRQAMPHLSIDFLRFSPMAVRASRSVTLRLSRQPLPCSCSAAPAHACPALPVGLACGCPPPARLAATGGGCTAAPDMRCAMGVTEESARLLSSVCSA